ncbi:MAG: hypothetical protein PHS41_00855 [Victivallaceae bacterium]|nr:hypothetical protein [Victivallaceae bacterium]
MRIISAAMVVCALLSGCMSFEYKGETFPETESAKLYLSQAKAPAGYTVIGRAVVSGSYGDITRERMLKKLQSEAQLRGAEAVIVTGTQVIPDGKVVSVDPESNTLAAVSADTTYSWNSMVSDFDGGYGEIGKKQVGQGKVPRYLRVIRAEFVRYGAAPANSEVPNSKQIPPKK